ncbi:hypothetical protein [Halomonas sp. NO4]|uniref:hypothetical protein n=1 Tax=Halomonas sp. NO4 TaxID=2484813 RepID=UPI001969E159|nr:hypothetical protein [Halomonas sp. NO4]
MAMQTTRLRSGRLRLGGRRGHDATTRHIRYNGRPFRAAGALVTDQRRGGRFATDDSGERSMLETNAIHNRIKDLSERTDVLRGYL